MRAARGNDSVRCSAVGWLRRLGWQYRPAAHDDRAGTGAPDPIHHDRLLQRLQAVRFHAQGQDWPLSADSVQQSVAALTQATLRQGLRAGNQALQQLLLGGIDTLQTLPDGQTVPVTVWVIDWEQVQANCWEIVDAPVADSGGGEPAPGGLVGYVNGLPLVLLTCAERDHHGHWAARASAMDPHQHGPQAAAWAPLYARAQLLLALDRRGGCYAVPGTPPGAWLHWREPGDGAALQRLRQASGGDDAARLRGVHAALLAGVLAPARLLQLLRGFLHRGEDGQQRIASAAQFHAVQAALAQLRRVDGNGRRQGGQLCLAAGSGTGLVRGWLLQALRRDPALRQCRVLVVGTPAAAEPAGATETARGKRRARSPAHALTAFMGASAPAVLEVAAATLHGWLRRRDAGYAGDDLIVLLDTAFWSCTPARLRRARRHLPLAAWLTIAPAPVAGAQDEDGADAVLLACTPADAVAAGSMVPVLYAARAPLPAGVHDAGEDAAETARRMRVADSIGLHFRDSIAQAERDLCAVLLVASPEQAQHYLPLFAQAGLLRSAVAPALPTLAARQEAELLIVPGPGYRLPREQRRAVLYIDCALPRAALLQCMAWINAPHPDKHYALMLDLQQPPALATAHAFDEWGPQPLQHSHAPLPQQHRRLRALLPPAASDDFHACRDHLGPRWVLGAHGQDSDAHRRRRQQLHVRVTGFGQQLQAALCCAAGDAARDLPAERSWRYRHDLHFCSVLRDAVNTDAQDTGEYRAEDVRIRHWARAQAPEVREPLLDDDQLLRTLDVPNPRRDADALHSRLRHRVQQGIGQHRYARQPFEQALRALLATPLAATERLAGLRALQQQIETGPAPGLPAALPPRPLVQACYGVLRLQLGHAAGDEQTHQWIALAVQLEAAVAATHASLPAAPHLFAAGLRRRLAAVLGAQLDAANAGAVLEALLALAPCGWQVD